STRGLCFDTREFGQLSPPADPPASPPHFVVGSTWAAPARLRFRSCRQKSHAESPVRDRIRSARAAFANVFAKIPGCRTSDGRARDAMPATARPQLRNSQNHPAHSRSAFVQLHRPRRDPAGSNKTRGCADENCGPNRTNAPSESHAIRPQRRIDRHRRRAGAIHLSPHAKHPPRPRIWKSFHVITNVGTRNARLGSFSRIFPDLTGLASEFAFQLTAKAFAHAIRDRAGNAASFWKAASFVIPSESRNL